jgi:hypothetical protein
MPFWSYLVRRQGFVKPRRLPPMAGHNDEADGDRISAHRENARDPLNRFDDVMVSAAANGCDSRIVRQLEIMRDTAKRFDETMLADAATAVPEGPGLDTLLAAVVRIPAYLNIEGYSKPHVSEKKKSPRAASYVSR